MAGVSQRHALLLIVAAALCWSLLGVWGKQAQAAGVGPVEIGFWRALTAGLLLAGQTLATGARLPRGRDLAKTAGLGLVCVATFYVSYQYAVRLGGASLASVLLYTAPAMVAVLGWAVLRERLSLIEGAAVTISITGVAAISLGGGAGVVVSLGSVTSGLTAGACYALYYLAGRRLFGRYQPCAVLTVMMLTGAAGLAPLTRSHPSSPTGWLYVAGLGLVCTWLAYLLNGWGLKHLPAARTAVVSSVEPVAAMVLAATVLGERLTWLALAGAGLVVGAAVMLGRARA